MMKPIKQENDRLGFVGIGCMGRPIARRLLESGFKLTAYDRDHNKAEELIPYYGGRACPSHRPFQNFPPVAMSCCRVYRVMKLSWTFIEGLTACSPTRIAARWSST